jgi:NAD(P)-dependent dehydrogenase (short-subunit alcohol dehydrogenase family)
MHYDGDTSLDDVDWLRRPWDGVQAYADSKLFDVTLALAVARRWPEVLSNAVEPGWVPTRMGGAGAPDDLTQGHVTQAWLATSHDGADHMTGGYLYHLRRKEPRPEAASADFEDRLLAVLEALTGEAI